MGGPYCWMTVCQRLINRIQHLFEVLSSLDPSLQRQHHHDTSMRENGQTSPTPANVFSMEAFQIQVTVHHSQTLQYLPEERQLRPSMVLCGG